MPKTLELERRCSWNMNEDDSTKPCHTLTWQMENIYNLPIFNGETVVSAPLRPRSFLYRATFYHPDRHICNLISPSTWRHMVANFVKSASSLSGLSGLETNVEPLQAEPPQCLWSTSNTGSTKFVKVVVEVAFVPTTKESFWRPSYRPPVRRTCQPWPPPRDASWRPDVGSHKDESRPWDRVLKMERLKHTLTIYIYHIR